MEVKIIDIGEDYVRLVIKGEGHTYLNLLQHYLVEDEDVIVARYNIPHPLIGEPEIYIKTSGVDPLEAVKRANEKIIAACNTLLEQL
ncbi:MULTISPECIES: RpoL/Rpb11 RNA polymerase subunit family protein [Archaeoglobus]|jgi:DNA-directed RNA polymerase subunit L|uniref:DNA-directed RNA polymerase subunit Rpo11 n=3 Tax=Archaeoglobus fulgidus TaxID=2234 RepID=RPO11_ARCFU|nr:MULTISPECIES: RpoL/Rpb11 RNA polymerase subunit family protein [Archaeoglobus]O30032.1 RecName: Full=DNA-directed RNA polymerase subunit Rpo11; AltName: Full=DNA-directed RNA polymerase subunit L [Archaeoglobus fulgidus DSM 4304]AAB91026.1 DNA-directed RNA polymerase, subunit L (rpoL) [Archaeoglobus fulgidus DSM 4304]AIG97025.1 DNA-directed RNA polymerase, subunit L [Archaeoglobus fulgidus DSM 8774]KUJ94556.1 MAG: DNA-directed RNA polymerase subunit L [Archaeoglobus fulgidus]KUK07592.1 MAG: